MGLHDLPGSPRSTPQKRLGSNSDEADDGPLIDKEGKYGKRYKVLPVPLSACLHFCMGSSQHCDIIWK